jgi:hypothetical protein
MLRAMDAVHSCSCWFYLIIGRGTKESGDSQRCQLSVTDVLLHSCAYGQCTKQLLSFIASAPVVVRGCVVAVLTGCILF